MVVAINDPIAVSATATRASATSASISVKPATARLRSGAVGCDNLDTSGEPVDANLEAPSQSRHRYRSAARPSGRQEVDRRPGGTLIAARGQQRFDGNIVRQTDDASSDGGANRSRNRADLGRHARPAAN